MHTRVSKNKSSLKIYVLLLTINLSGNLFSFDNQEQTADKLDRNNEEITEAIKLLNKTARKLIFEIMASAKEEGKSEQLMTRIDELFQKNSEITKIAFENRRLIHDFIVGQKNIESQKENNQETTDSEAYYFIPKQPSPLTAEEKKIDLEERIKKKYIGEIPRPINTVIGYLENHTEFEKRNIPLNNRILLHGKPGGGKSYLVEVIAQELQLPILSFTASFFSDKYIGESSRRIRKVFEIAVAYNKPILIFIDEIDALAVKRKDTMHNEHRAALLTLITELEKLKNNKNVIIFVATNDLKALDDAIKDRFSGSTCEIKDLSLDERALLFEKLFKDNGNPVPKEFARRLSEVTDNNSDYNKFSNREIESIVKATLSYRDVRCKKNPASCRAGLCKFAREAIDDTRKSGRFAFFTSSKFCDGI